MPEPTCEKGASSPSNRLKRDTAAIRQAVLAAAGVDRTADHPDDPHRHILDPRDYKDVGLPLGKLEDQRWGVSPTVAREKLREADLPYGGRKAGLIYSWSSILRAEGIDAQDAKNATRATHPDLFEDLLDTSGAAALLGYKDASSIRKLVGTGQIPETAFIQFATRGVYRFRPEGLRAMRKMASIGRIV